MPMQISGATGGAHAAAPRGPRADTGLATALGVDPGDLQAARRSGTSLAAFAAAKGISADRLLAAVKSDITAHAPTGRPALTDDQLTQMATDMINRTPGSRRPLPQGASAARAEDPSGMSIDDLKNVLRAVTDGTGPDDGDRLGTVLSQLGRSARDGSTSLGLNALA